MKESDDRREGERRVGGVSNGLEPLKQEVAANTVAILGVLSELREQRISTTSRVENMRAEQARLRRLRTMMGAATVSVVLVGYDQHIEHCSPGSRVTRGFNKILDTPIKSQEQQKELFLSEYNHASVACDVTMPFHTHDGESWPTQGDSLGIAILAIVIAFWVTFHIFKTRFDREDAKQAVVDDTMRATEADKQAHWKLAQEAIKQPPAGRGD